MSPTRREGVCQGDFAATVKEILPIDKYKPLVCGLIGALFSPILRPNRGDSSLTGRTDLA
jgi:hypothetical protein